MEKSKKYLLNFLILLFVQNSYGFNYFSWPNRQTLYQYWPALTTGLAGTAGLGYFALQKDKSPLLGLTSLGLLGTSLLGSKIIRAQIRHQEEVRRQEEENQIFDSLGKLYNNKIAIYSTMLAPTKAPKTEKDLISARLDKRNKEHLKTFATSPNIIQTLGLEYIEPLSELKKIFDLQWQLRTNRDENKKLAISSDLIEKRTQWLNQIKKLIPTTKTIDFNAPNPYIPFLEELYFFYVVNRPIPGQSQLQLHTQEINKIFNILSDMYQQKKYILNQKGLNLLLNNLKMIYGNTYSEFLGTGKRFEREKKKLPSIEEVRKARLEKIIDSKPIGEQLGEKEREKEEED